MSTSTNLATTTPTSTTSRPLVARVFNPCFPSILYLLSLILALSLPARAADLKLDVDWPKFLSRHDLLWSRPPEKWGEGAFTGNGLLGAMVYLSDDKSSLRFRIGRSDVMVQGVSQPHRLPIGDLLLTPAGKITGLTMRLDLYNAEITGSLTTDKGSIPFRTFTHATDLVQIIDITPTEGEKSCTWKFEPGVAVNPRILRDMGTTRPIPDDAKNPAPVLATTDNLHTIDQKLKTGGGHATAWQEFPSADGKRILFLSVGWGDDALNQAATAVASAAHSDLSNFQQSHRAWWHSFYPASFLSLPDTRLESFYWIQLYKLASATRPGRPPIDLMGPWFNDTPWPRIWWNLNIQLTYYPIYAANHLELAEPFAKMIDDNAANLSANAGEFSEDSETISRTSGYDCRAGNPYEICNYPWALHNYYTHYRHNMDDAMLRDRLLPRMKRAMNYYFHFMEERDGKLHLTRGHSPEYPNQPRVNPDCNIDLGLIRWLCQALLDSHQRLKLDDPLIPKWKDTLARLTPYPTNENGLMVSASIPWVESHRHYSHLLAIYPLYVLNWDQPESRDLITRSLDHWLKNPSAFRGYSWTGAASICAQIGRKDKTVEYLNHFVDAKGRYGLLPNTHYTEAGPVIETPLSAARTIQDMVLQSWGDKIRIFPGIPDNWKDLTFHNLRTEGAFLVSATRKNGQTQWVHVKSEAGEPCRLKTDIPNPTADRPLESLGNGVIELKLAKGESALIYPKGEPPAPIVAPVPSQEGRTNTFGLPN